MKRYRVLAATSCALAIWIGNAWSQPKQAPTTTDAACASSGANPPPASDEVDTVVSAPDAQGFFSIFDGTTLKGWWQDCQTTHSSGNRTLGAIFRADPVHHAIYAMSREGVGGILCTKKKYSHYEIIFDWWPQYGNDGGIFNRTTYTGQSNQMVLDYLGASGILGMYSEGGFPGNRNQRPWSYNSETSVSIPGSGSDGGPASNWTNTTKGLGSTKFGCASSGCGQADLLRLWNTDGWNQVREEYYGGLSSNQSANGDKIHTNTFFRKFYPTDTTGQNGWVPGVTDTAQWIPVIQDSLVLNATQAAAAPKSWIGFQVHTGNRYIYQSSGGLGSWYRNIKIRELDENGKPLFVPTSVSKNKAQPVQYDIRLASGVLVGSINIKHTVTISDIKGHVLRVYSSQGGSDLRYSVPEHYGLMLVQVKTERGTQVFPIARLGQ